MAAERRIDPDDGAAYTFEELSAYYRPKGYKKKVLEAYWEEECTPVGRRPKTKAKAKPKAKPMAMEPTAATPKPKAKPKAKVKAKAKASGRKVLAPEELETDGPLAKEIAAVIPYFPFKKLDKFYDVQGLLKHPKLFNLVCSIMAKRFRRLGATKIAGVEARGFLYTPVAIKLGVPFVMLRKAGKMPNTISSAPYTKEYEGVDTICIQRDAVVSSDKVILIDDLVATGGTLCAGVELIKACGAEVLECGCMVELKALNGRKRVLDAGAKSVWGLISEDILTQAAELPQEYTDDGQAH